MGYTFGIQRRDRLHTYKRPYGRSGLCARARIVTAQQDSIRGTANTCDVMVELARCRSDLSLTMPIASLCVEFWLQAGGTLHDAFVLVMRLRCHGQRVSGGTYDGSKRSPLASMAHRIRACLFATATSVRYQPTRA
jgi:hypothetical protein